MNNLGLILLFVGFCLYSNFAFAQGDEFENDDTPETASLVIPDAHRDKVGDNEEIPRRTFHKQGDIDWIRFSVREESSYFIIVEAVDGSSNPQLTVYGLDATTPDPDSDIFMDTEVNEFGIYFAKIENAAPDEFGENVAYTVVVNEGNGIWEGPDVVVRHEIASANVARGSEFPLKLIIDINQSAQITPDVINDPITPNAENVSLQINFPEGMTIIDNNFEQLCNPKMPDIFGMTIVCGLDTIQPEDQLIIDMSLTSQNLGSRKIVSTVRSVTEDEAVSGSPVYDQYLKNNTSEAVFQVSQEQPPDFIASNLEYDRGDYVASRDPATGDIEILDKAGGSRGFIRANETTIQFRDGSVAPSDLLYWGSWASLTPAQLQGSPVFRFFNTRDSAFFYTVNPSERDLVLDSSSVAKNNVGEWPYVYQGSTFAAATSYPGSVPLFRFYNRTTGHHFFTASLSEKAFIERELADRFNFELVSYNVYLTDPNPEVEGKETPIYRFYSRSLDRHFFTGSKIERDKMITQGDWEQEGPGGVGFWAEKL